MCIYLLCTRHAGKNAIHGYSQRVIHPRSLRNLTVQEIYHTDSSSGRRHIREDITSAIPHVIRSSHAYKKTRFLDLMCMFRRFGAPQLFMTFTCNDFAPEMLEVVQSQEPWSDPVRFANHFRHMWNFLWQEKICRGFANHIGGIREFFWVMELQARGSPHVHVLLWTGKGTEQLMNEHIVTATLPPAGELRDLVVRHQIHRCTTYCKATPGSRCRFGMCATENIHCESLTDC